MTVDADKLTDLQNCTQGTYLIGSDTESNHYGTIKVSDITDVKATQVVEKSSDVYKTSQIKRNRQDSDTGIITRLDKIKKRDNKNNAPADIKLFFSAGESTYDNDAKESLEDSEFVRIHDPILHSDIKGFMEWACKKIRYYYALSRIVESPSISLDTLLKSVKNQNNELVMACVNANMFTPNITIRDIDIVDMIIDIISESYHLGCNMSVLNPELAESNDKDVLSKILFDVEEKQTISEISKWSVPIAEVFRVHVIKCIKKEVIRGIKTH